jgi:outer membrane phospholipase A
MDIKVCLQRFLAVVACLAGLEAFAADEGITAFLSSPAPVVAAGKPFTVKVLYLNSSQQTRSLEFGCTLRCAIISGERSFSSFLVLPGDGGGVKTNLPAGGFAQRDYSCQMPEKLTGKVYVEIEGITGNSVCVEVGKLPEPAAASAASGTNTAAGKTERLAAKQKMEEQSGVTKSKAFHAREFFNEHFFPYEPFYFIAGPDSPNAKFQISFKYSIINRESQVAEKLPELKGIYLGYTQTSLWDLSKPSAPFMDTSYKPEVLYSWDNVDQGRWGDAFRLNLQGGVQHESNGRDGLASRSLNIFYLRPSIVFGKDGLLQFTVSPTLFAYLGDLSDNPDLSYYRGYAGLRTILGWEDGLQLSSFTRLGDTGNRASELLDLTYPLNRIFTGSLSLYLHVQYFIGYGESLLYYNERSSTVRFGFSLFR